MGQMMATDSVSTLLMEGRYAQLTVHCKVTSVDPEFRIMSPILVKDILSASGPVDTTLTSSTDKSYTKAIIRITADDSKAPTDGRLL